MGGVSQFQVGVNGTFIGGNGHLYIGNGASGAWWPAGMEIPAASYYAWSATSNATAAADTYLTRSTAATLHLGLADAAAPVAQTLGVQNVVAGTTNTAGANFTITGSQGTGTAAGGKILFQTAPAGTTSGSAQNALTTAMTITGAGNVGIGTTTPATLLQVGGPATGNYLELSAANVNLAAYYSAEASPRWEVYDGNGSFIGFGSNGGNGTMAATGVGVGTPVGGGLALSLFVSNGTAFTERMRINGSGNIGIGTTVIANRLDVNGAESIGYQNTIAPTNGLLVSGMVGLGTATAVNDLDVYGGVAFGNYAGTVAPTGGMIISGNVGIGTTTPTTTLQVAGTSTLGANGALQIYDINAVVARFNTPNNGYIQLYNSGSAWGLLGPGSMYFNSNLLLGAVAFASNMLDVKGAAVIGASYAGVNTAPSNGLLVQGSVGIGSTAPMVSLDMSSKTDAFALPVGTTFQRPSNVYNGMIRYNSTLAGLEAYIAGAWTQLSPVTAVRASRWVRRPRPTTRDVLEK